MGMPPSWHARRLDHMHFMRYRGGKAVEHWGVRDELGMMQQMGLIPKPGQPGDHDPT
jgi:predicted ester cyclase